MEKAIWIFAGILVGAVVVAALARIYPAVGVALLDADAAKNMLPANGPGQAIDEQLAAARAQGAADAAAANRLASPLVDRIPPNILRLFPRRPVGA